MIGAVSSVGSYSSIQRYAQVNPVSNHAAAEKTSVITAHKSFDLETPVQPAEAIKPVNTSASGNLNVDLTIPKGADAAEMSVRMRLTSAEEDSAITEAEADKAAHKELLEAEEKKEAKREAYLEQLKEQEAAREERIEALKETQAEEDGAEQPGTLELDRTGVMLRNHQMNNLMQDMLSARTRGEDTSGYSAAIDALLHHGQERVRFSTDEAETADARRYYQQQTKQADSIFGAVA